MTKDEGARLVLGALIALAEKEIVGETSHDQVVEAAQKLTSGMIPLPEGIDTPPQEPPGEDMPNTGETVKSLRRLYRIKARHTPTDEGLRTRPVIARTSVPVSQTGTESKPRGEQRRRQWQRPPGPQENRRINAEDINWRGPSWEGRRMGVGHAPRESARNISEPGREPTSRDYNQISSQLRQPRKFGPRRQLEDPRQVRSVYVPSSDLPYTSSRRHPTARYQVERDSAAGFARRRGVRPVDTPHTTINPGHKEGYHPLPETGTISRDRPRTKAQEPPPPRNQTSPARAPTRVNQTLDRRGVARLPDDNEQFHPAMGKHPATTMIRRPFRTPDADLANRKRLRAPRLKAVEPRQPRGPSPHPGPIYLNEPGGLGSRFQGPRSVRSREEVAYPDEYQESSSIKPPGHFRVGTSTAPAQRYEHVPSEQGSKRKPIVRGANVSERQRQTQPRARFKLSSRSGRMVTRADPRGGEYQYESSLERRNPTSKGKTLSSLNELAGGALVGSKPCCGCPSCKKERKSL